MSIQDITRPRVGKEEATTALVSFEDHALKLTNHWLHCRRSPFGRPLDKDSLALRSRQSPGELK